VFFGGRIIISVIKKIEDSVAEISEIKKVESFANENFGFTIIEFNLGVDVNDKAMEVKDKVGLACPPANPPGPGVENNGFAGQTSPSETGCAPVGLVPTHQILRVRYRWCHVA
jgi:hypothetical protein